MTIQHSARLAVFLSAVLFTAACGSVYAQGRNGYPQYPGSRPSGGYRVYQDPAYMHGYDDGYERGLDDARDGDRYDARRDRSYRSADRGYRRSYGPKGAWKQNYRDGFSSGYDAGYRDGAAYGRNGRYGRGPWRRR